MPFGQETDRAYSPAPRAHTGLLKTETNISKTERYLALLAKSYINSLVVCQTALVCVRMTDFLLKRLLFKM